MRHLFLAFVALLLASCATSGGREVNKADFKLDPSSDRGGVIFGWRILNPDARATFYNVVWTCYDPATKAVCPARDPNSEKNAFGVPQKLNLWGAVRRPDFAAPSTLGTTTYQVFLMPPGTYVLSYLTEGGVRRLRWSIDGNTDAIYSYARPGTLITTSPGPRFMVEAGKMVYVGDLTFDLDRIEQGPPRIDYNEAAARAALAEYPNMKAQMWPALVPD